MAEILRSYDWAKTSKHNTKPRNRTYPWDELLDGRIRRLTKGEDFDGPAVSVERVIRTSANRRGIKVRVRVESDDSIILQAHTDNARNMARGVTKSPSKASIDAARAEANGEVTKTVAKRPAVKAAKPSVNGNASKRPSKAVSKGPSKGATPKAVSKRLAKAGL